MVRNLRVCLPADGAGRIADDGAVGDGGVAGVDDQRDVEGGLEGGLVEAGEGAARVGGLELGDGVVAAGGFGEIKAAQLVVQDAGVGDGERGLAGGKLLREGEGGLFLVLIEGDGGGLLVAGGRDGDGLEGDLGGVEGDVIGGLGEGYVDGLGAGEGGGFEVGREGERVVRGNNVRRQALGAGCGGGGQCGENGEGSD